MAQENEEAVRVPMIWLVRTFQCRLWMIYCPGRVRVMRVRVERRKDQYQGISLKLGGGGGSAGSTCWVCLSGTNKATDVTENDICL